MLQDLKARTSHSEGHERRRVTVYLVGSQSTFGTVLEHFENEVSGFRREVVQNLRLNSVLENIATGLSIVCSFERTATDQHTVEDAA